MVVVKANCKSLSYDRRPDVNSSHLIPFLNLISRARFLSSNSGSQSINQYTRDHLQHGAMREDIKQAELEEAVKPSVINTAGSADYL